MKRETSGPDVAAQAFGATVGDVVKSVAGLSIPFAALHQLQSDYVQEAAKIWNGAVSAADDSSNKTAKDEEKAKAPAALSDRRFSSGDWSANPMAAYVAAIYLLNARTLLSMADSVEGDEKTRQRIRFAVQQWLDASAPSNFLAFNPEAQRRVIETKGESIAQGVRHLLDDLRKGYLSQTDETVFEVGRNVATTEGSVVFENELFQLIEYKPLTEQVYERPLLIVPPCINKFYILDLQPDNSLVRYVVEQGHRLFLVSWRNADESIGDKTWDDYIEDATIRAIDVVREISGQDRINTLGFCIGGTLLATALAVLAAKQRKPAASVTLLTTFLDFSDTGVLHLFVDEAMVQMREVSIGKGGILKGQELASTFSFLRPNDLVWNYVVGNYLKGERPPPFDLLYWNSDGTNLPGPMFCWYLRNTYLENNLVTPGKVKVCGVPVDLGKIDIPAYIYSSREDHIVPWTTAYGSTQVLGGDKRFVLGGSGHIAGVVNPPAKKKRNHWTQAALPVDAQAWFKSAQQAPGSWWPDWIEWLNTRAGEKVAAPKTPGYRNYKVIEPAPGRYVMTRA